MKDRLAELGMSKEEVEQYRHMSLEGTLRTSITTLYRHLYWGRKKSAKFQEKNETLYYMYSNLVDALQLHAGGDRLTLEDVKKTVIFINKCSEEDND